MVAHDRWLLSQVGQRHGFQRKGLIGFSQFCGIRRQPPRPAVGQHGRRRICTRSRGRADRGGASRPKFRWLSLSRAMSKSASSVSRADKRNALHKELKPLLSRYEALETELSPCLKSRARWRSIGRPRCLSDHARSSELLKTFEALQGRKRPYWKK